MAISSLPSNFFLSPSSNTSPPQSLFFVLYHPRSLSSSRAQKLKISCCQQTVQFDNEPNLLKNKKRKPRPSFLQQVHDKWSQKMPSLRENFPWQEQEIGDTNLEEVQEFSSDVSSVKEPKRTIRSSEPVRARVEIKSNSAPWAHGSGNRKVFIADSSRNFAENVGNGTKLAKDKMIYDDSERKFRELDEAPIGLPPKFENLEAGRGNSASVMENPPTVCGNANNIKSSAGGGDLSKSPWKRKNSVETVTKDRFRDRKTVSAERSIPEHELKRLRNVSLRMVERIKVGAAGVTQALVYEIHDKWKDEEVVKLKFEGPPSKNMKRTHDFLESRTGGLVIWRSGSSVVLYRGLTYKFDCVKSYSQHADAEELGSCGEDSNKNVERVNRASRSSGLHSSDYFKSLSEEEQMDLSELNLLLDELGPRFMDWTGREPIPVDADLLPAVVPGYKTPYRLLPHGSRRTLRDKGMTFLRRAARAMPPHFALGRSRQLQGLAAAMVKLWEKSAIAKIVIKRGVLNTNNERMAEELKILTGGTLLSRNKEYIVLYRGNDFLPPRVSTALVEMEKRTGFQQDEEELARQGAAALIESNSKASKQQLVAGTLAETVAATSRWGNQPNDAEKEKMFRDAAIARQAALVESLQKKLAHAKGKIRNAEKTLEKVLKNQEPEELPTDLETLTDEERQLFRRIGSSMKPYLVLGRREVFRGTIENMHLHWRYRELVKILVERKTYAQVRHIAISLEAESGGVLVSVERTPKGCVILVYRGKNYRPPPAIRPQNLLTKRQAFARSIELQRREALIHHVVELEERIEKMKQELDDMKSEHGNGVEALESSV
ncbi:CRM-domain containing factor CFM3, chloroplastic/mitochondrial-like [Salvia splendens]|uniref:CRM-domain containing factor CFM3, chloroplastic/mitochondrial-like n=1 Tax=Salvia splendens TaxID=180675 RepID=UPI001104BD9C|nr:CRM-domain containing factor CFM3, chloroplastic/mitochondrial-like [Salvia splendens]